MKTILIIFLVYWSGFALSWFIAARAINKYQTKESPLKAALFSWLGLALLFLHTLLYVVSSKYSKWIDGNESI